MAFHKLISASEAPTIDVEIPTPSGPIQVRLPRLDFVPQDVIDRLDDEIAARFKEVEERRREVTKEGRIAWDADRELRYPNDLIAMQLLLDELVPEHAEAIAAAEVGVRRQLWAYWEGQSNGDLGKSAPSAASSPRKRTSKRR